VKPVAVLIHVPDVALGLAWYQQAFVLAEPKLLPDTDLIILDIAGFMIEIVQADHKVGAGKMGTVLYWHLDSLAQAIIHFEGLGARLYRGPMAIENGMSMCQIEDPFGNLIGLRGILV